MRKRTELKIKGKKPTKKLPRDFILISKDDFDKIRKLTKTATFGILVDQPAAEKLEKEFLKIDKYVEVIVNV